MNAALFLGLGLLLGLRHAAEADHVAAVAAIAARTRSVIGAVWLGVMWGLGHSFTLFAAGGAIILLRLAVPPRVALGLELAVAMVLILVGLSNLGREPAAERSEPRPAARWAFAVGLVHGLAGSAATALLVLATAPDPMWGLAYMLALGAGTLFGMALITLAIASPVALAGRRLDWLSPRLRVATGMVSIAVGVWMAYQIGWVDGLFRVDGPSP